MALITTIVNSASANNIRIETPAQKLLIVKTDGNNFANEIISLKKIGRDNKETQIVSNTFIRELKPFVGLGEGVHSNVSNQFGFFLEIAPASPNFENGDAFVLDLTGLTAVTCNYEVYAINAPAKTDVLFTYNRNVVSTGQTSKSFPVDGAEMVAIQNTATRLIFTTESGETIDILPKELNHLDLYDSNLDTLGIRDTDTSTAELRINDSFWLCPLQGIVRVQVDTAGTSDVAVIFLNID